MNQKQRKIGMGYVFLLVGILFMLSTSVESQAAVRKPSLSRKKLHMTVGKQDRLSIKNKKGYAVSWKSSKKAVASVSKTGKIKAKKCGDTKITAVVKPNQGGKTYRLVCKVSVKKEKKQRNITEKKPDRVKISEQSGNSSVRPTESPIQTAPPGSSSATSDPAMPDPSPSNRPISVLPAVPATGSAVTDVKLKLLFGDYNDGLLNGDFFGNRMIVSYDQLQNLICEAKEEMGNVTWQGGCDRLQWYINQMETIGQDYFTDHVLCINTMMVARGYDYTLDYAEAVVEEDGTKTLQLCLGRHYNLKDGECVTCDMPYYSFFIQLPREVVQGCERVVCSLVSSGVVLPSGNPEDPYMIQDVLQVLEQVSYPLS